jgi:hypothetical protein
MIERKGKLIAKVITDTKGETLTPEIIKTVKQSASVITDEWLGYNSLKRIYDHSFVKHNEGEYMNGKIYTNTIEGFWSLLKRGIIGIYHFTTRKHLQKYVDEFSFFEMIYKMRGWTWNYAHKYPGVVGIWINDIVYERIAPLVLAELQEKNPIIEEKGHRKYKHHQYLSEDIGIPKLLNHLSAVEALGRASGYNWSKFMIMLDTAFPKQYQQLSFIFDDYEDKLPKLSSFDQTMKKALDYDPNKDKEKG